ncbi:MAG TPA: sialidase family protein [Blastocatellia bacterium]
MAAKKIALAVLLFFSTAAFPVRLIGAQPIDDPVSTIDVPASPADDPDPRNQPSIAVSAINDQIIVGASKVIVGGATGPGTTRVAHYFSSDGGRTWGSSLLTLETPQKTWQRATDPSVASDMDGNFYLAVLMFDTSSFDTGVYIFKSTDGGRTFIDPEPVVFDIGNPSNPTRADKCYITVDRSPSSPFKNTIYAVWMSNDRNEAGTNRVRILLSHRRSGELSFSPPKVLSHSGDMRGPSLATGPEGEFYAVWEGIGFPRVLLFNASTDGGETFLPLNVAPGTDLNIYRFTGSLSLPSPTILISGVQRMNSFPVMDVDRSAGPNRGMIYIAWAETTNRSDADVFMMRLTPPNGGHPTISSPLRVNNDPTGADQFFPWLNVDETDGSVEVAFYDRRDDINNLLANMYLARSTDGGLSFTTNTRVSASSSDPRIQSNVSGVIIGIGDHIALDAARGKAHLMWTDTRRGKQEIFYGQIPFSDSGGGEDGPLNDSCQTPRIIDALTYIDNLETSLATSSPDDPVLCAGDQGTHSVWYRFTPSVNTVYGLDSFGSNFDTVLSVYTGACGSLAQVACDDDSGPGNSSLLTFTASAGQTYLIEVAGKESGGMLRLRLGAPTITSVEYTPAPNGSDSLKIQGAGFAENNTRVTIHVGSNDIELPTIFYTGDRQSDGTVTTIFATKKKLKKKVKRGKTVVVTVESPLGQNNLSIPFPFTRQ